ncbi:thioredoxin-dependent thiol peroxidase [Alienimonas sp. DA493]|uniref:thioredoxin-dependent thiol peroxidase n=1 Tax=Alienimonas sp. DA493 TaxID=3373605 RepID=UPI003754155E
MSDSNAPAESVAPPQVGDAAPDVTLVVTPGGEPLTLSDVWADGPLVLYFYPKDATPGCTTEACDFRDRDAALAEAGATVLGVSPDPPASHEKFIAKQSLPFRLLSDEEKTAATAYGVWVEKSMYGRKYMGVQRATFLIGQDGKIAAAWPKVKVKGHADAVLEALAELKKNG